MVQAAINGHNQFKRAQALEGKALLQAEQRYLQRQRRRRGLDENDSSGDLPGGSGAVRASGTSVRGHCVRVFIWRF